MDRKNKYITFEITKTWRQRNKYANICMSKNINRKLVASVSLIKSSNENDNEKHVEGRRSSRRTCFCLSVRRLHINLISATSFSKFMCETTGRLSFLTLFLIMLCVVVPNYYQIPVSASVAYRKACWIHTRSTGLVKYIFQNKLDFHEWQNFCLHNILSFIYFSVLPSINLRTEIVRCWFVIVKI